MTGARTQSAWLERSIRETLERASVMRAILLLFAFVLLFARFEEDALSANDTALHAGIARRMAEGASWTKPTLYGRPWFEHMPPFLWTTAASIKLFGFSPGAARLPGLLFAWIAILAVFELARLERGPAAGLVAGVILSTTEIFWRHASRVRMDVPLACFIALAVLFAELAMRRHRAFFVAFGLCTGAAIFEKGPMGLAPVAAVVAMLVTARPRYVRDLVLTNGWFWAGIAAIFVVPAPWMIQQLTAHSGWYERYVLGQVIGLPVRGTGGGRDPSFALIVLLKTYWPWLPLLVLAAYRAVKAPRTDFLPLTGVLGWVLFVLVALMLSAHLADYYLIPIYPAFGVIGGHVAGAYLDTPGRGAKVAAAVLASAVLLAVVFAVTPVSLRRDQLERESRAYGAIARVIERRLDPPRTRLAVYGLNEDRAVWTLGMHLDLREEPVRLRDAAGVGGFLKGCQRMVVMPEGPEPSGDVERIGAEQGLMVVSTPKCADSGK